MELARTGVSDSQAIITAWNSTAAKGDRVVGEKFMTVKNLLDMNPECRSALFAYISERGMNSCSLMTCVFLLRLYVFTSVKTTFTMPVRDLAMVQLRFSLQRSHAGQQEVANWSHLQDCQDSQTKSLGWKLGSRDQGIFDLVDPVHWCQVGQHSRQASQETQQG